MILEQVRTRSLGYRGALAAGERPRVWQRPPAAVGPVATLAPRRRGWRLPVLFALALYLLFCHGCHGDEDHELFARVTSAAAAAK